MQKNNTNSNTTNLFKNDDLTYEDILKYNIKGVYCAVDYHPQSCKLITDLICKDLKIVPDNSLDTEQNEPEKKLHTTILYHPFTKNTKEEKVRLVNYKTVTGKGMVKTTGSSGPQYSLHGKKINIPKLRIPIKIVGFGYFDIRNSKNGKMERNLHIKVKSKFLEKEWQRAKDFGFVHTYTKYKPHITLKDSVPEDFKIPPEIIKKYIGTILYTNDQYINKLSLNY